MQLSVARVSGALSDAIAVRSDSEPCPATGEVVAGQVAAVHRRPERNQTAGGITLTWDRP